MGCKKFWMPGFWSRENAATFAYYNCGTCRRFFWKEWRELARPICILNFWEPVNCGTKFGVAEPVLHLGMDDDASNPKVYDGQEIYNQTFIDPGGTANTSAHSTEGQVGKALAFDGVDDTIVLSDESVEPYISEGTDFTFAFWWKVRVEPPGPADHFFSNYHPDDRGISFATMWGHLVCDVTCRTEAGFNTISADWGPVIPLTWQHYAVTRNGLTISIYRNGVLRTADLNDVNSSTLFRPGIPLAIGSNANVKRWADGACDDFRLYNRALTLAEIEVLAGM